MGGKRIEWKEDGEGKDQMMFKLAPTYHLQNKRLMLTIGRAGRNTDRSSIVGNRGHSPGCDRKQRRYISQLPVNKQLQLPDIINSLHLTLRLTRKSTQTFHFALPAFPALWTPVLPRRCRISAKLGAPVRRAAHSQVSSPQPRTYFPASEPHRRSTCTCAPTSPMRLCVHDLQDFVQLAVLDAVGGR